MNCGISVQWYSMTNHPCGTPVLIAYVGDFSPIETWYSVAECHWPVWIMKSGGCLGDSPYAWANLPPVPSLTDPNSNSGWYLPTNIDPPALKSVLGVYKNKNSIGVFSRNCHNEWYPEEPCLIAPIHPPPNDYLAEHCASNSIYTTPPRTILLVGAAIAVIHQIEVGEISREQAAGHYDPAHEKWSEYKKLMADIKYKHVPEPRCVPVKVRDALAHLRQSMRVTYDEWFETFPWLKDDKGGS